MEKKRVIGFYDYTVVLTYLGLVFAFMGIIMVLKNDYYDSIILLMLAGVCDMFDGAVASTKERNKYEKQFGIQIDSLCDLISFGLLPALFVYKITGEKITVGLICCAFTLCGLIRLAYFNVQEAERQSITNEKREVYLGVPITTSAIMLPLTYLMYNRFTIISKVIFIAVLILLGAGYIAGVEIKKPNLVGKIAMILLGIVEMVGVFFLTGADLL